MRLFKGLFKRVKRFVRLGIAVHTTDFLRLVSEDDSTSFNCKIRSRIFVLVDSTSLGITGYITSRDILSMKLNIYENEVILFLVLSKDATRYVVKEVFSSGDNPDKFLKRCLPKSMLNQERFK